VYHIIICPGGEMPVCSSFQSRASPLFGQYRSILLDDTGTCLCVWTTCSE